MENDKQILLHADHLTIGFEQNGEIYNVVNDISFQLREGEILGIVGESGSGKTMTALSIIGLLSKDARVQNGSIQFEDKDLLKLSAEEFRALKGSEIAMIFQEPMTSLNPVMTVGHQVEEMLILHNKELSDKDRKEKTLDALQEAGLGEVQDLYHKYPHQLSGGMRQRVMIAMAMICNPKLLIADEPTTALDVTIQANILNLIQRMSQKHGTAVILISHDLGVIKKICSRAIVMQDGVIVEQGYSQDLFLRPENDYTKKLIAAMPSVILDRLETEDAEMKAANADEKVEEAAEEKTNKKTEKKIKENADETTVEKTEETAIEKTAGNIDKNTAGNTDNNSSKMTDAENILEVHHLNVFYDEKSQNVLTKKQKKQVIHDVSLNIRRGEILGIVGESGSGKSSLAKAIVGLMEDKTGEIRLDNIKPQMVFQDPYGSLNPAKRVDWILEEPLKLAGVYSKRERKEKVAQILKDIGLEEQHGRRYLSQLSGGQRQRVAIGVAVIQNSKLIVLDEPVSALDVTVQSQILDLLKRLQQEYDLSYLFISHDLNVIYLMCDRVCVMYQGQIVETSEVKTLYHNPKHPYSKKLLDAVI